jgi:hypothetical protein
LFANRKIFDAVLSGIVADGGPDLLDQRGAGRFDGDARKHGPGRIPYHTGDDGLRRYGSRHSNDEHEE